MTPEYWCIVYITNDRIRCTTTHGMAAIHLAGGTTYNKYPQPTRELAIKAALESAAEFRAAGYRYEKNWLRALKRKVA